MAVNPIQRKTRNAFILGMLLAILIAAIIVVVLFMQIKKLQDEKKAEEAKYTYVYTLSQDVKSGQIITRDMLSYTQVKRDQVPIDAILDTSSFMRYSLVDAEGNELISDEIGAYVKKTAGYIEIYTETVNGQTVYYTYNGEGKKQNVPTANSQNVFKDDYGMFAITEYDKTRVYEEATTGKFYILKVVGGTNTRSRQKEYYDITNTALIAKVNMNRNTVLTLDMLGKSNQPITNDVRKQELNSLVLPIDLSSGDYVDIRLMLPNGVDYIVVSKKQVEIPQIGGTNSADTIWVNMTEDEILTMSCAIVDAFKIDGAKLYTTIYTDPGMQEAATPTYMVNAETANMIRINPNILSDALTALRARYSTDTRNTYIESQINRDTSSENYKSGITESIQKSKTERQQYLDSLSY